MHIWKHSFLRNFVIVLLNIFDFHTIKNVILSRGVASFPAELLEKGNSLLLEGHNFHLFQIRRKLAYSFFPILLSLHFLILHVTPYPTFLNQ